MTRKSETERKRDQRARAAAGQVHRVTVWLTEEELRKAEQLMAISGDDLEKTMRDCLRYAYADAMWAKFQRENAAPRQTPPTQR